jgi:BMFP domain-containing protein YqiC
LETDMQTENRILDDLARVASGAFHTLGGLREEIETRVRERLERVAADLDLVSREEFEAARSMAAKARADQEVLAERLTRLEAEMASLRRAEKPAPRRKPGGAAGGGATEPGAS